MTGQKKTFKERLEAMRQHYRLVIMNSDTFDEVYSFNLSLMNVYALLSTIILGVVVFMVLLFAYTPIKRFIPGMEVSATSYEYTKLNRTIDSLERAVNAQRVYTEDMIKAINGEVQTESQVSHTPIKDIKDSISPAKFADEAANLVKEVDLDDIQSIAKNTNTSSKAIGNEVTLTQLYFVPPISGEISAGFNYVKDHFGVDVLAPANTPIKATMDGVVIESSWTVETGNIVAIQHGNNIISMYKHNSVNLKRAGDRVKSGEAIAIIGNTGTLTNGPHLHFELWYKGTPVDPVSYVMFN